MSEDFMVDEGEFLLRRNAIAVRIFEEALREFSYENFSKSSYLIDMYQKRINKNEIYINDNRRVMDPEVSVVIVAYATCRMLIECIKSVLEGSFDRFEIIVVDNGENDSVVGTLHRLPILYVKSPCNLFLSEARNIGVCMAQSPICVFLDDDAIADRNFLKKISEVFSIPGVFAVRGRVIPKTKSAYQDSSSHYDEGDKFIPHVINTEGNSAWRRDIYRKFSGMDPLLFGHEGTELSERMNDYYGKWVTFYCPDVVIYHDYAITEEKKQVKEARHERMLRYIKWKKKASLLRKGECGALGNFVRYARSPVVSVVLSAYNAEKYIESSISSVLNQRFSDIEVLVVDDGSSDGTSDVVRKIKDRRVVLHRCDTNQGLASALNMGFSLARGKYIARMDADDLCSENRFVVQLHHMEKNRSICVCGGAIRRFGHSDGLVQYPSSDAELKSSMLLYGPFAHPFVIFDGEFVRKNGIMYNVDYKNAQDYELWMRIGHEYGSCIFGNVADVVGWYRVHAGSESVVHKKRQMDAVWHIHKDNFCRIKWNMSDDDIRICRDLFCNVLRVDVIESFVEMKNFLLRLNKLNIQTCVYGSDLFRGAVTRKFIDLCRANLNFGEILEEQVSIFKRKILSH